MYSYITNSSWHCSSWYCARFMSPYHTNTSKTIILVCNNCRSLLYFIHKEIDQWMSVLPMRSVLCKIQLHPHLWISLVLNCLHQAKSYSPNILGMLYHPITSAQDAGVYNCLTQLGCERTTLSQKQLMKNLVQILGNKIILIFCRKRFRECFGLPEVFSIDVTARGFVNDFLLFISTNIMLLSRDVQASSGGMHWNISMKGQDEASLFTSFTDCESGTIYNIRLKKSVLLLRTRAISNVVQLIVVLAQSLLCGQSSCNLSLQ